MLFQAGYVETYSLNLFFSLIVILIVMKAEVVFREGNRSQFGVLFLIGCLVIGLGLGNHSLLVMCLGLSYLVYFSVRIRLLGRKALLGLLFLIIGLSVYLYL